MLTDNGNQNSAAPHAYNSPNNGTSGPSANPFRVSNAGGNRSYSAPQSPFANARSRGNEFANAQGYESSPAPASDQEFTYARPDSERVIPIPSPASPEPQTWSQEFADFSRISQQSSLASRQAILEIYDREQLQLYDNQQFAELHLLLQTELKRNPNSTKALIGVALCYLSLGEPQKSAEYFSKAIDIDESIRPAKYLLETPQVDPDDWLDMAEELGHCGILEGSMEVCSNIVDSNQFSDKVRRQAQKVREAIRQDYFAARERIIIGNAPKSKEKFGSHHLINSVAFVLVPLALAIILGCVMFYAFDMSNGKTELGRAIYRLERLKRGDTAVERMGTCDRALSDALECFNNAATVNPFSKEACFYKLQTTLLLKELGRTRVDTNEQWDAEHWQAVKSDCLDAEAEYEKLSLSIEKDQALKQEWKEFYDAAKSEEGAPL